MDDILFRHTAIATPNEKSEAFTQRIAENGQDRALVNEALAFDDKLQALLKVPTPEGLTDKILLEQSFAIDHKKRLNNRWHIATAASITFIIGLTLPSLTSLTQPSLNIGTAALQHVQKDYYLTSKVDEHATLPMINAKLASYGGTLQGDLGDVTFVNYCNFEGTPALHMVIKGEKGPVTVFVVPNGANVTNIEKFHDQHLKGLTEKMGNASVVIVGEKSEPLEKVQLKLQENIIWNI